MKKLLLLLSILFVGCAAPQVVAPPPVPRPPRARALPCIVADAASTTWNLDKNSIDCNSKSCVWPFTIARPKMDYYEAQNAAEIQTTASCLCCVDPARPAKPAPIVVPVPK